ncbi:MAG: glycerol dehydrogenase, partial [Oscillospiraceae bacterium]
AFGLSSQLVLENSSLEEINSIIGFCKDVGLPTPIAEIGLAGVSDEDLMKAAEAASVEGETIHCEPLVVTADKVFAAMKAADSMGRAYKG